MISADTRFTISARGKPEKQPVLEFLKSSFSTIPLHQVDSVFGFVEPSTLYSGRPFMKRQLSESDVAVLHRHGIGLRIPLSNHYLNDGEYSGNLHLLKKYHYPGNSVICTNDRLAIQIRNDFPSYQVEASVLKEIDTVEKISEALEIYDTVILPMNLNYNTRFLASVNEKERVTLFGNAGCALTCPNRICYEVISGVNKKLAVQRPLSRQWTFLVNLALPIDWCSNRLHPRRLRGLVDFDLIHLNSLGFKRFKMLREHTERQTGY